MDESYRFVQSLTTANPLGTLSSFIAPPPIYTNCGNGYLPYQHNYPTTPPSVTGSKIPYYHQFLCEWATGFPSIFHWVVLITPKNIKYFRETITNTLTEYEKGWYNEQAFDSTFNEATQNVIGCIFAHNYRGINEGGSLDVSNKYRGFVSSPITNARDNIHEFSISFKETNSSFVDSVLKPWAIMTTHHGLIARPEASSIKADITIYELTKPKTEDTYDPVDSMESSIRKITTYRDCAPIKIANTELKTEMEIQTINVDFAFNTYSIETL